MKSIFKTNIFIIVILLFTITGCDDILNTIPKDFNSEVNYFLNEDQVYNALGGCYSPLADYDTYGGQLTYEAIMDDLGYWNWKSSPSNMINRLYSWNYNSSNATIKSIWGKLYSGVGRANLLLEHIDKAEMDSALRETYRNEALFLRAYYHFVLNVYWGDIPIKLKSIENVSEVNVPRNTTDSVMRFVINEMERVIASGNLTSSTKYNHAGRITQTVAHSIIARVYLKAAGYPLNLGAPMYQKALEHALIVKNSNIHKLHPEYQQLFINQSADAYDDVNRESIWEAEFYGNSVTDPGKGSGYSHLGVRIGISSSEAENYGYGYGFVCARLKLIDLYNKDVNDKRKPRNIANYSINSSGNKVTISNVGEMTIGKWRREDETLVPKHKNFSSTNMSIIRYADVLLMIAEAENELNGPTKLAHDNLNEVRARAGVITFTAENDNLITDPDVFRQEIQDERARELCFEGIRKIDLVRWGIFLDEMQMAKNQALNDSRALSRRDMMVEVAAKMTTRDLLFPIPQSELKINNKMTQNPLW